MADLKTEVESGDKRRALIALRDVLAARIQAGPDDKDLASLSLRLERVLDQIEQTDGGDTEETDELAARRLAKLSGSPGV
jgi:hypothetical protein